MKTLKFNAPSGIALLFICVAANAITKPTAGKPTKDDVVKNIHRCHYQRAMSAILTNVLADDLQFGIQRCQAKT